MDDKTSSVIQSYTFETRLGDIGIKSYAHCWEIQDIGSKIGMNNGETLESSVFTIKTKCSQTDWRLQLCPNGDDPQSVGYLSIFLKRESEFKNKLVVRSIFKFLDDNEGIIVSVGSRDEGNDHVYDETDISWGYTKFISHSLLKDKGITSGNYNARIQVEFMFIGDDSNIVGGSGVSQCRRDKVNAVFQLSSHIDSLYQSGKFSDCIIVCGNKEFQCHKTILASRSPVFDAMLSHDMEEKKSGRIVVEDLDVDVVQGMLEFIYSGHVKDIKLKASGLLAAADKYDLTLLKQLCVTSLCLNIDSSNVLDMLVLSEVYNEPTLRSLSLAFTTEHTKKILELSDLKLKLKNHPELLAEMYKSLAKKYY